MSVIEVECPECNAIRGAPCFYAEEVAESLRIYRYGLVKKDPIVREGRHKGTTHRERQKAATARRNGRARIGLPYTLEVDFDAEKVKLNILVPNIPQGTREVREEEEQARLKLPATKGEVQAIKERLDKLEGSP
jgi:hypothetical protein